MYPIYSFIINQFRETILIYMYVSIHKKVTDKRYYFYTLFILEQTKYNNKYS